MKEEYDRKIKEKLNTVQDKVIKFYLDIIIYH